MIIYKNKETKEIWDGSPIQTENGLCFNPTPELLVESGWIAEEQTPIQTEQSLKGTKQDAVGECNNYYNSTVLNIEYKGSLFWIPRSERVAYKDILKDCIEEKITKVTFRDNELSVLEALKILKDMNIYEFKCREIRDNHVRNITKLYDKEKIEDYDYTVGYPERLKYNL